VQDINHLENMENTLRIKHIKKENRKDLEIRPEVEPPAGPDKWSTEVRSWVAESQQRDRTELLPAFDSLFSDVLPQPGQAD
jgi:hypothetical protein